MSGSIVSIHTKRNTSVWLAFKEGNWDAYTQLYNDHFKMLNNYGHKFTRDVNIIEDAVHDLFIKLWLNRANLGNPASVKNYLFKSLRGIIFRKMHTQSRYVDIEDNEESSFSFEISFDHQLIANEEERHLQRKIKMVIEALPPRQREIIYLRFYEGLGYDEIADIMEITTASAYKLIYKAFSNMQDALKTSRMALLLGVFSLFSVNMYRN